MRDIVIVGLFLHRDVRIDLGATKISMSQASRDFRNLGTLLHHVGCKRVPQAMRSHLH